MTTQGMSEFDAACRKASEVYGALGDVADDELTESGDLRAIGVSRTDTLRMAVLMLEEFGPDLRSSDGSTAGAAVLAIVENTLAVGVWLERNRWENAGA
jgi:hypothetical protein